jgi:hypothetical protein
VPVKWSLAIPIVFSDQFRACLENAICAFADIFRCDAGHLFIIEWKCQV